MNVLGLMSGTSVDSIDLALVSITGTTEDLRITLLESKSEDFPPQLQEQILAVGQGKPLSVEQLAQLDDSIAETLARSIQNLQKNTPHPIDLIGSHGQTVFHRPYQGQGLGYSLQLGRGELIAELTQIPTVSNFRRADIAQKGQGAPLVPKIDAYLLGDTHLDRAVQNIGGISNVTFLPARSTPQWEEKIIGWDTGPGNTLIDLAVIQLTNGKQRYDKDGNWASQGEPCQELVVQWLQHPFFQKSPPKSTGRELFGEQFLRHCWDSTHNYTLSSADWLATLTEFTAKSIEQNYRTFLPHQPAEILLCGGGQRNLYLKQRLTALFHPIPILTTDERGVSSDYKEAIAFAILAYWRYAVGITGNLPQVTGAKQPLLLGEIALPIGYNRSV